MKLTKTDIKALQEAARRPGGWGLFFEKTTKRLGEMGLFEIHTHPMYRCGTDKNVHGHHHDYSKPLDVEWLCSTCHGIEHRKPH